MTNSEYDFLRLFPGHNDQLARESERGAVIVSAALIDEALEDLIKAKLMPSPKKEDELFVGTYAPLESFSAKTDFAYRLGLIGISTRNSLHQIRKLRNDFAHLSAIETFESNKVQNRVREIFRLNKNMLDAIWLAVRERNDPRVEKLTKEVNSSHGVDNLVAVAGWRGMFEILVSIIAANLRKRCTEIEPLT
jgi:hypothetical protein